MPLLDNPFCITRVVTEISEDGRTYYGREHYECERLAFDIAWSGSKVEIEAQFSESLAQFKAGLEALCDSASSGAVRDDIESRLSVVEAELSKEAPVKVAFSAKVSLK